MELSILVGYMKARLAEHRALVQPPHPSQNEKYYSNHQAQMTLGLFEDVITQLEKFIRKPTNKDESLIDPQINANHIKIITSFFEYRWQQLIKNTDEYYFIQNNSPVNLLCKDVAEFLATNKLFVGGRNKNELLMPTVTSWYNPTSKHHLETYYWHDMLLSDEAKDGSHRVMEMGYFEPDINVDEPEKKYILALTMRVEDQVVQLSREEAVRVHYHSFLTRAYYNDFISRRSKNPKADPNQRMEDELVKALRNETYCGHSVESTYGKKGLELLKKNLLKNVNRMFITREQLFDYLSAKVAPEQWATFLEKIDPEVFFNLMVAKENVLAAQQKESKLNKLSHTLAVAGDACLSAKGIYVYNDAVLFCFVSAYWQVRDEDKNAHTGVFGFFGGWDKASKQAAVEDMKKLLTHQAPHDNKDYKDLFLDPDIINARNDGILGIIFKLMCKHLKSSVSQEHEVKNNTKLTMAAN